jgi:hypothetical protein
MAGPTLVHVRTQRNLGNRGERQWDFFVIIDGEQYNLAVDGMDVGKLLVVCGKSIAFFGLSEWEGPIPA